MPVDLLDHTFGMTRKTTTSFQLIGWSDHPHPRRPSTVLAQQSGSWCSDSNVYCIITLSINAYTYIYLHIIYTVHTHITTHVLLYINQCCTIVDFFSTCLPLVGSLNSVL